MYGERLKQIRSRNGLTLEDVGKKLGVRHSTVAGWEKSSYPPLKGIEKICRLFNVPLLEFFAGKDELDNYMPSWLMPEQIVFLKSFSEIPKEKQKGLLSAFITICRNCL